MNEILTGYNEQGALNRHPVSFATAIQFLIIFKIFIGGTLFYINMSIISRGLKVIS